MQNLLPDKKNAKNIVVILTLRYIETLPSSTVKWLIGHNKEMQEAGNLLLLAGVGSHVFKLLEHTGLIDAIGKENIFLAQPVMTASIDEAMVRAQVWPEQKRPAKPKSSRKLKKDN